MKKFVNDVEQMLTESLQGLAAAHSDLLSLHLDADLRHAQAGCDRPRWR